MFFFIVYLADFFLEVWFYLLVWTNRRRLCRKRGMRRLSLGSRLVPTRGISPDLPYPCLYEFRLRIIDTVSILGFSIESLHWIVPKYVFLDRLKRAEFRNHSTFIYCILHREIIAFKVSHLFLLILILSMERISPLKRLVFY